MQYNATKSGFDILDKLMREYINMAQAFETTSQLDCCYLCKCSCTVDAEISELATQEE
jgi:hypothetical protein